MEDSELVTQVVINIANEIDLPSDCPVSLGDITNYI